MALVLRVQRLHPSACLPHYSRPGDAALDLHSAETRTLQPGERHAFRTGLAIAVPPGYVGLVWDRSGLALRSGLTTLGGVIDATYRGEVKLILLNAGHEPQQIHTGDRIGQLLVQEALEVLVEETADLEPTERGAAGFGSSGR